MLSGIQIIFNSRSAAYYPGQHITGMVKIGLNSAKISKGVQVKFKGKAKVCWSKQRRGTEKTYRSEEDYYEMEYFIWGNGRRKQTLNAGEHQFPFDFVLPLNIPGSFESSRGRVKHECSAKLLLSGYLQIYKKRTVLFSVNPVYDLNTDPLSLVPINSGKQNMTCCICCQSGPISIILNISQSGFVCGEFIAIFAECSNQSSRIINSTRVALYQIVIYQALRHYKTKKKMVHEIHHPSIQPGDSDIWAGDRFEIPSVPPTHLPGCSIINIQYELLFSACPSGWFNLTIKTPIIIGTIPLQQNFNRIVRPPEISLTPSAPVNPHTNNYSSDPPDYLSLYLDCPPPSYDECKMISSASSICNDSSDDEENDSFRPRYVCYGFT